MPNNPVQIVLNDSAFLRAPDAARSGPDKDFFNGDDERFLAHQRVLVAALDAIDAHLATSPQGPLAYVRVRMRMEAIAKSYRPNRALFRPDQFPVRRSRRAWRVVFPTSKSPSAPLTSADA